MFFYRKLIKNWKEKKILSGTFATDQFDNFGFSVVMNSAGDRVIVAASFDETSGGPVDSGLAYIFVSQTGGWSQQVILSGSLVRTANDFGLISVAMNSAGDRVIVGAHENERSGGATDSGVAYIFVSGAGGWSEQNILSGSRATGSGDNFGFSVAMNSAGNRVIVGAYRDEASGSGNNSGLAYVFVSGAGGWSEQNILSGSRATASNDNFGNSVAMNSAGDRVVVGAWQDEASGSAVSSGLAYVFVSGAGGWSQQHILSGSLATGSFDGFGYSVAINSTGDRVIVGAPFDERSSQDTFHEEGLAYIFVSGAGGWSQQHILSGSLATDQFDGFGYSVAMNSAGNSVIVGSFDQAPGADPASGLAYIFNEE